MAKFSCLAHSYGKLQYNWKRKSHTRLPPAAEKSYRPLPHLGQLKVFALLTISDVKRSDSGQYCCVATNEGGMTEQCAPLIVN